MVSNLDAEVSVLSAILRWWDGIVLTSGQQGKIEALPILYTKLVCK
jgi:hypothetical protein